MTLKNICLWGDSIGKGVVFDEQRKRYAICRESCATMLSQIASLRNFSVMGQTTREGLARMKTADIAPNDVIAIEYGGNDCDLDWKSAAEHPDVSQYGKVPIDEFADNLSEMIQIARGAGINDAEENHPRSYIKEETSMAVNTVNSDSFDRVVLKSEKTVLVDFWATWCAPCKMMGPVVEELAQRHPEIEVAKVNVDESPELAAAYRIAAIPALKLFKNGVVVNSAMGFTPIEELEELLK